MTSTDATTWTWLVAHGDYRPSVCVERDGEKAAAKFRDKHERYETITRPAGHHWDGGHL